MCPEYNECSYRGQSYVANRSDLLTNGKGGLAAPEAPLGGGIALYSPCAYVGIGLGWLGRRKVH